MSTIVDIIVSPNQANDSDFLLKASQKEADWKFDQSGKFRILKRSIDARQKNVRINLRIELFEHHEKMFPKYEIPIYSKKEFKSTLLIVGAGPAGLFAALRALELGIQPIIVERGKEIRARRRDLAKIGREQTINPESNYCFGEGGAGTYSDGKLYTRSKKRGNVLKVLENLVHFGAPEDILIDAHPHIGTNKLPAVIENIREKIIQLGGIVHFESKVVDFIIHNSEIKGVILSSANSIEADGVLLATGHSARDIYELLHHKKIQIEAKPFALGVRVEHQQSLIDQIQYHSSSRPDALPPASYSLVEQIKGIGVYSFCMCPGGIIAPCATSTEEVVTNGWSPSKRNNPYSNSGIVVGLEISDFQRAGFTGPLAGLNYQKSVEKAAWIAGGKTQRVPAQRLVDFSNDQISNDLPITSYTPGIVSTQLSTVLPESINERLRFGFERFGKKMKGYFTNDAVVHGVESRTSSPVRIPRDGKTLEHPEIKRFFPCGEGAGYAGGIVSAAVDGIRCVNSFSELISK